MADPASLTLSVSIGGLSHTEASEVLRNLTPGSRLTAAAIDPPLGSRRYQMTVHDLSVKGAADLTTALHQRVAELLEP